MIVASFIRNRLSLARASFAPSAVISWVIRRARQKVSSKLTKMLALTCDDASLPIWLIGELINIAATIRRSYARHRNNLGAVWHQFYSAPFVVYVAGSLTIKKKVDSHLCQ